MAEATKTITVNVNMTDGRTVTFSGAKRKMLKTSVINEAEGTITTTFDFRNGEVRKFQLRADDVLFARFAAHGIEQKIGDEASGTESVDDMVLDIEDVIERLANGEWGVRREGGGNAGASVLMQALAELYNKPLDAIKTFLSGKTQAEKMALRANAKVKPIVDRIEAERAAKSTAGSKVDSDALLGELA